MFTPFPHSGRGLDLLNYNSIFKDHRNVGHRIYCMSGILDTDRAVAVVTYALSSLAIYWGCKRSVAVSTNAPSISLELVKLTIQNDSRTASSQELPMRHDYMQGAPASLRSWGARCSFVAGVIIAMGLIGVFSHLVVYLTSREFPNWLFAIATVAQITHSMHEVSHRFNLMYTRCGSEGISSLGRRSPSICADWYVTASKSNHTDH